MLINPAPWGRQDAPVGWKQVSLKAYMERDGPQRRVISPQTRLLKVLLKIAWFSIWPTPVINLSEATAVAWVQTVRNPAGERGVMRKVSPSVPQRQNQDEGKEGKSGGPEGWRRQGCDEATQSKASKKIKGGGEYQRQSQEQDLHAQISKQRLPSTCRFCRKKGRSGMRKGGLKGKLFGPSRGWRSGRNNICRKGSA